MKGIDIIAEHQDYIIINKPAGILSIPDRYDAKLPSVYTILEQKFAEIFIVHRLDKNTSGIILFACNEQAHQFFSQQFENRAVQKYYHALVHGKPTNIKDTIVLPIAAHPVQKGKMVVHKKGKPAITEYEVLESFAGYSWLQVQIHTGRTHQIRVHLQYIGHPIVADELYGDGKPFYLSALKRNFHLSKNDEEEHPLLSRMALHASRLELKDMQGNKISYEAPLPKDISAILYQLRKIKRPTIL